MKPPKVLLVLFGILCSVLIIFVGIKAWNAYTEHERIGISDRERDTITVNGEGKVTATPDIARASLGVQTDAPTVKAAQSENTNKMNGMIAAIKALGVASEDIGTENYNLYPKLDWKDGSSTLVGYTVNQSVWVKIRDLDKVGDILAKAGELGANQVGGISFTIDDPTSLRDQARQKAIEEARKKAETLANQLGLTIVKVVTFAESDGGVPPMPFADKAVGMGGGGGAPQIEPGSQDVVSNVNVTFEVR